MVCVECTAACHICHFPSPQWNPESLSFRKIPAGSHWYEVDLANRNVLFAGKDGKDIKECHCPWERLLHIQFALLMEGKVKSGAVITHAASWGSICHHVECPTTLKVDEAITHYSPKNECSLVDLVLALLLHSKTRASHPTKGYMASREFKLRGSGHGGFPALMGPTFSPAPHRHYDQNAFFLVTGEGQRRLHLGIWVLCDAAAVFPLCTLLS